MMDASLKAPAVEAIATGSAAAAPATLIKVCLVLTALNGGRLRDGRRPSTPEFCNDLLPKNADLESLAAQLDSDDRLTHILRSLPSQKEAERVRQWRQRQSEVYRRREEEDRHRRFRFRYTPRSLSVIG